MEQDVIAPDTKFGRPGALLPFAGYENVRIDLRFDDEA